MSIKRIRKNIYEEFKMNKYDLFETTVNEIGGFPLLISGFYYDNSGDASSHFLGFKINSGWDDLEETATYISKFLYMVGREDEETKIYYTYEEFLHYFLTYYLENTHCYANFIAFIELEFINYVKYIDNFAKTYTIKLDIKKILEKDKLRNFLLEYNFEENRYLYGFINFYNEYINYWDIDILKKFMSYLMGKDVLKKFLKGKRDFKIQETYYFEDRGYNEGYTIEINKNDVLIDYYTHENRLGNYLNVVDKTGRQYKGGVTIEGFNGDFVKKEEVDAFPKERYKGTREKMNVEVILKENFIKELEIIINAYEKIYIDDEVQGLFEKFKKELGE